MRGPGCQAERGGRKTRLSRALSLFLLQPRPSFDVVGRENSLSLLLSPSSSFASFLSLSPRRVRKLVLCSVPGKNLTRFIKTHQEFRSRRRRWRRQRFALCTSCGCWRARVLARLRVRIPATAAAAILSLARASDRPFRFQQYTGGSHVGVISP